VATTRNYAELISEGDALRSYKDYEVSGGRVDFRGPAIIGDLDCRGCWSMILKDHPSVDTGYAPWHEECYEYVKEVGARASSS